MKEVRLPNQLASEGDELSGKGRQARVNEGWRRLLNDLVHPAGEEWKRDRDPNEDDDT